MNKFYDYDRMITDMDYAPIHIHFENILFSKVDNGRIWDEIRAQLLNSGFNIGTYIVEQLGDSINENFI